MAFAFAAVICDFSIVMFLMDAIFQGPKFSLICHGFNIAELEGYLATRSFN